MKNNLNQTKRFCMAAFFAGSVNFSCGRLGSARSARGVAPENTVKQNT